MATFTTETVTTRTHRWIIPATEPWGTAAAEIGKAWAAAEKAYRAHYQVPENVALADNALNFHIRDDEIVIAFDTEAQQ